MLKINSRNNRTRCETCSDLTIEISSGRHHWLRSGVFTFNFEHISYLILVSLILVETCTMAFDLRKSRAKSSLYIEYITPSFSVSTVDFEHVFIFWVWSFCILIVFRVRWIQFPFINKIEFHKLFREKCLVRGGGRRGRVQGAIALR